MRYSRLFFVCLLLSSLSISAYASRPVQPQTQSPDSNSPFGQPDSSAPGKKDQGQSTQINDDGGSLRMGPADEKQKGSTMKRDNNGSQPSRNAAPADSSQFDSM